MLEHQNIKYKATFSGSCFLLLLLTFFALNPITNSSVYAEEDNEEPTTEISEDEATIAAANDDLATLAATTSSTIGVSFSPASYYSDLSPTNTAGTSAKIDITATIYVYNSGGYTVYLKSNDNNSALVGRKTGTEIPAASTAKQYTAMDVNTWGYAARPNATSVLSTATYGKVTTSGNGDVITSNSSTKIPSETKTIALSFAAKINNTKPADTYSNSLLLSVVSKPMEVAATNWAELTTMQQMTHDICNEATSGNSKQLKDERDGKYYWVSKLADGNCWMTQNLALDLSTNPADNDADTNVIKTLTDADTDLNSKTSWTPTSKTYSTVNSSTILANNTGQRSWNLGSYYIKNPNSDTSCGSAKNSLANCTSYFSILVSPTSADNSTNAHYLTGDYYQWNAATAGSGETIKNGQAQDSICPKSWKLPTSGSVATDSFGGLLNAYSIPTGSGNKANIEKLVVSPFYFVKGGYVDQTTSNLFTSAGTIVNYWSSTLLGNVNTADVFQINSSQILPSVSGYSFTPLRQYGYHIRCVAR